MWPWVWDQQRMTAYYDSVRLNPRAFKDKVVMDVGAGSGILAIWAAQAARPIISCSPRHTMPLNPRNEAPNFVSMTWRAAVCSPSELRREHTLPYRARHLIICHSTQGETRVKASCR
jgi:hypothetical protein